MMNLNNLIAVLVFLSAFSGIPKPTLTAYKATASAEIGRPASVKDDITLIPWSYTRKLTWEDFLCSPQRNTDAVALTSTSLGLAYQVNHSELNYQINCEFSKDKSWGSLKTDYILAHEQGHFDITEIYARKLNKAMQEYQFNPRTYKHDINVIYESIVEQKEACQEAYDGETDHSRNKRVQMEWLKKINTLLEETAPYATYP